MINAFPYWMETNSASRVYLALAIAQHGSFQIDPYLATYGDTQDKASRGGHYYSDKAPGTSFLFAPVCYLVAALAPGGEPADAGPALLDMTVLFYALRLLCVTLPTVAFWWFTLPWFREWTGSDERAIAVATAGALGTNFFIYSTQLFAHVPAACLLFLAFLSARRLWHDHSSASTFAPAALAGALGGLAFLNDYVVMPAVAVLGIATLLVPRIDWRRPLAFAAGLLPLLGVWMAYNIACFGHPLQTGFHFHADPQYGDAYRSGLLGIQGFDRTAPVGMLFSPARGMLFLSPFLALAPLGWWKQIRSGDGARDAWLALAAVVSLLLFVTTTIDWRGGWGIGTRYLVPSVPFLLVGVAGALRGAGAALSIAFAALATVGMTWCAAAALTFPLFPQEFDNPLASVGWGLAADGYFGPHLLTALAGVAGLVPFAIAWLAALGLLLWSATPPTVSRLNAAAASLGLATVVLAWQFLIPETADQQLARDVARFEILLRLDYLDDAGREMLRLAPNAPNAADGSPREAAQ